MRRQNRKRLLAEARCSALNLELDLHRRMGRWRLRRDGCRRSAARMQPRSHAASEASSLEACFQQSAVGTRPKKRQSALGSQHSAKATATANEAGCSALSSCRLITSGFAFPSRANLMERRRPTPTVRTQIPCYFPGRVAHPLPLWNIIEVWVLGGNFQKVGGGWRSLSCCCVQYPRCGCRIPARCSQGPPSRLSAVALSGWSSRRCKDHGLIESAF